MANRLLFGNRSGTLGLFISKPGIDVLTATDDDLLFNADFQSHQFIQTGTVTIPATGSPIVINYPNVGFRPIILFYNPVTIGNYGGSGPYCRERVVIIRYPTLTSLSLIVAGAGDSNDYNPQGYHLTSSFTTRYGITRLNADG